MSCDPTSYQVEVCQALAPVGWNGRVSGQDQGTGGSRRLPDDTGGMLRQRVSPSAGLSWALLETPE